MFADVDARTSPPPGGHCIDCPARRGHMLRGLIADSTETCGFETQLIEPRERLRIDALGPGDLVMVRRGVLVRTRLDAAGHAVAVDAVGPGASFIVGEEPERSCAYAVDRTLFCAIGSAQLLSGLQNDQAGVQDLHRLLRGIAYRLERFSEARGQSKVRSRVAATLSTLADTLSPANGRRSTLPSALLQRDIAALASTRHESVCRILREFSEQGVVEHGPDGIRILDHERLSGL